MELTPEQLQTSGRPERLPTSGRRDARAIADQRSAGPEQLPTSGRRDPSNCRPAVAGTPEQLPTSGWRERPPNFDQEGHISMSRKSRDDKDIPNYRSIKDLTDPHAAAIREQLTASLEWIASAF